MELAEPEPLAVNTGNSEAIKLRGMITKSSPAITTILQRRRPLKIIRQLSLKPTRITELSLELSLEQEDTGRYKKIQRDTRRSDQSFRNYKGKERADICRS